MSRSRLSLWGVGPRILTMAGGNACLAGIATYLLPQACLIRHLTDIHLHFLTPSEGWAARLARVWANLSILASLGWTCPAIMGRIRSWWPGCYDPELWGRDLSSHR